MREEGRSFEGLLDEVRHQLSMLYPNAGETSVGDVASLLGFSEASAFHRAFRRWTGSTPRRHVDGNDVA